MNALKGGDKVTGRITIPDQMASSLIQPAGREWRDFQRSLLPWIAGIAILGMLALLAVFFFVRGRIRCRKGILRQDAAAVCRASSASPTG